MTQRELSRLTAFSTATISMREGKRYESFPSMSTIEYYCEAFEISVYSFVFEIFWQADSSLSASS
jgi:transcriptional regulator with XRE-family HTH domain